MVSGVAAEIKRLKKVTWNAVRIHLCPKDLVKRRNAIVKMEGDAWIADMGQRQVAFVKRDTREKNAKLVPAIPIRVNMESAKSFSTV